MINVGRSTGKYCVIKDHRKVSCHRFLRTARKKALQVGGRVADNMDCKSNRGKRCGAVY